ncbi:MAG: pitrilysin family protein, partial [Candidatus Omnitrophota bacterium]
PHPVHADEVSRHVLDNGTTVLIKEFHKSPLVAIRVGVKTGSATETPYLGSGISHFVEHMLFKGTPKRPPGRIEKEIKSYGGYINGFTGFDTTGYHMVLPAEHLEEGLDILSDIFLNTSFDPEEVEKERDVILKEINLNKDDPSRCLSGLLWGNAFKDHTYKYPVIGFEPLFRQLSREDLLGYYRSRYTPENFVLGIAGDIKTDQALQKAKEYFGGIERRPVTPAAIPEEPPQIAQLIASEEKEIGVAHVALGFHTTSVRHKDLFPLDVLSMILGQGRDSRLFRRLYLDEKLVYSIGSANYTPRYPGMFIITFTAQKDNVDRAITSIMEEISLARRKPVDKGELEKAKNQVLSSYLFSLQSVEDQAEDIVSNEIMTGDCDFSKKYVEGISGVDAAGINRAARQYLIPSNLTIAKLLPGKRPDGDAVSDGPGDDTKKIDIKKIALDNGITVLLGQDHSQPIVSVKATFQGGLRAEDFDTNGISNFTARLLLAGTKKRTEAQIFKEIEGLGAGIGSFSAKNSFGIGADLLSRDADKGLDIVADCIMNPVFPEDSIERERQTVLAAIKRQKDDIYETGIKTLNMNLYKTHPYRLRPIGRPRTVKRFTRADIVEFYETYYTPGNMVLAVFGDIDAAALERKIRKTFSGFKRPDTKIDPPAEPGKSKSRTLSRKVNKEQSLALIGYLGTTIKDDDRYALEVLSSVLSGVDGRMSAAIR